MPPAARALAGQTVAPDTRDRQRRISARGRHDRGHHPGRRALLPHRRRRHPTADSHIGFEVWLPPASAWNGKFQGEGSGGSAGAISPGPMLTALKAGYATMSTDNGHVTDPDAAQWRQRTDLGAGSSGKDGRFRLPRPARLHRRRQAGGAQTFTASTACESYFVGCSQGGHHALMEATRFPDDYDGIVAGAPAWHWANQMINATWNSRAALQGSQRHHGAKRRTPQQGASIAACDKLDGVEDGVISDPRRCHFDPATLLCKAGDAAGRLPDPGADRCGEPHLSGRAQIRRHGAVPGLCRAAAN